jgi:hypothetical protein
VATTTEPYRPGGTGTYPSTGERSRPCKSRRARRAPPTTTTGTGAAAGCWHNDAKFNRHDDAGTLLVVDRPIEDDHNANGANGHGSVAAVAVIHCWMLLVRRLVAIGYQPMTMFDSIAFWACSRSDPVSCM